MTPRVTVIIAAYQCPGPLRLALRSVLDQTFEALDVRVIGDHCEAGSAAVVAGFADRRVSWTNLADNSGSQSAPNNEGIRQARGEYIAYLGQDDLWLPDHVARLVELLDHTGAAFGQALGAMIGPDGPLTLMATPRPDGTYVDIKPRPGTWMHRRVVVDRVGWWSDHRMTDCGVDADFRRRVMAAGLPLAFSPTLTMLKFPAALFAAYAGEQPPPQQTYADRIQVDAAAVRRDVIAAVEARSQHARTPLAHRIERAFAAALKLVFCAAERAIGEGRWPFRAIRHAVYQRRRRAHLARKGLSHSWIARTTRPRGFRR